jgi:hypothetical protein
MTTITITQTFTSKTRNGGGGGAPPLNTVTPVISGSSAIGSTLSSTTGTWTGTPTITYSYQWKRAGVDIVGETNSTYVLVVADYNVAITCVVTATNAFGSASATSNSITGTGVAPVNTVAPVISGTPTVGQTLSSTTGTWTGNPTPTYTYQWKRNGSNIASATSSTYTLVQADATFAITCAVTGTNVVGQAEATSNSLTVFDADAQAFFTASGLTGATNLTAINQLVVDLKTYGIWTKMKAIYPIIGGTAALHKWNLKDPRDLDAAFRLVFSGGMTHSSTGIAFGGVNGYGNTYLDTQNNLSLNSGSLSYYSRTNAVTASIRIDIGSLRAGVDSYSDIVTSATNLTYSRFNNTATFDNISSTTTLGFFLGSRTASNIIRTFRNGVQIISGTAPSNSTSNIDFYIGAANSNNSPIYYSNRQCAFASIGDGLTNTEAANFYTAVQAYNTTLGRNNP